MNLNANCYSYCGWSLTRHSTGSVPWLFVAMVNDSKVEKILWKFADDSTLAEVIPGNCSGTLQDNIYHIVQ